jgi:hypothetical protein
MSHAWDRRTLLGRLRFTTEDNTDMHLKEIGWEGVDWINLTQDREQRRSLVKTVMNLPVLKNAG